MNGIKYLFDACAIVDFIHAEKGRGHWRRDINNASPFVSVITRMEVLAYPGMTQKEELARRSFLKDITVVPISADIEEAAIAIRKATKIKLPDCIIAAAAIVLDAALLTSDDMLLKLSWPGLRIQNTQ
jgi:predicted nucleic acid-binding protein